MEIWWSLSCKNLKTDKGKVAAYFNLFVTVLEKMVS
jgi:hypothetical protein